MADNVPLRSCESSHAITRSSAASLISCLLLVGGPSAVVGKVASIVIDAIYGHPVGTLTHVTQEIFKAIKPAIAHCNSTPAVICIPRMFVVGTSLDKIAPRMISGSIRLAVRLIDLSGYFAIKAAATTMFVHRQVTPANYDNIATYARTFPRHFFTDPPITAYYCEARKRLSC